MKTGGVQTKTAFLLLVLILCLGALGYEVRNIARDYIAPVFAGTVDFFADFQFFYEGAQRFLESSDTLYEGNTRDGFLMIKSGGRIDYGYPPPAVLLFVPFALLSMPWALLCYTVLSIFMALVCVWLIRTLCLWNDGVSRGGYAWTVLGVLFMALGTTYVTFIFGQVNTIVLAICLLYIAAIMQEQYGLAGIVMGVGFWLKFYPVLMLVLAPFEKKPVRLLSSAALSILLLPIVLIPVLPVELYDHYFTGIYPELARQTAPHVYNQSITGYLTRLVSPREMLFSWGPLVIDPRIRAVNGVAIVLVLGWIVTGYFRNREHKLMYYACMLAATPMLVTYGWGGTYMLAVPLLVLVLLRLLDRGGWAWLVFLLLVAVFIPVSFRPFPIRATWARLFEHVYYSRYLFAVVVMIVVVTWRDVISQKITKEAK